MTKRMTRILAFGLGLLIAGTSAAADKGDIRIGLNNWAENTAVSNMWKILLEERGYDVTLWNPHWAFAEYELKYLDDPKNVYGQGENIHWMSRPELADEHSEVIEWMNAWQMSDQPVGGLMATIRELDDPAKGARRWIDNHEALVARWFEG